MDHKSFGSESNPLRASGLPSLLRCPWGSILQRLEDGSGPAADTGSAVHKAAFFWHQDARRDTAEAMKRMTEHLPEYPLADLGAAEEQFRHYARDPRNIEAETILCEREVRLTLAPPEGDTSPVVLIGHPDHVRIDGSGLILCDIKTGGTLEGAEMLDYYAPQLCTYQVAVSRLLGRQVNGVRIIRTKDYLKKDRQKRPKPGIVHWNASWTYSDALHLLDMIRAEVGRVRRGEIRVSPSAEACRYCPGGGIANCLTRLRLRTVS